MVFVLCKDVGMAVVDFPCFFLLLGLMLCCCDGFWLIETVKTTGCSFKTRSVVQKYAVMFDNES